MRIPLTPAKSQPTRGHLAIRQWEIVHVPGFLNPHGLIESPMRGGISVKPGHRPKQSRCRLMSWADLQVHGPTQLAIGLNASAFSRDGSQAALAIAE